MYAVTWRDLPSKRLDGDPGCSSLVEHLPGFDPRHCKIKEGVWSIQNVSPKGHICPSYLRSLYPLWPLLGDRAGGRLGPCVQEPAVWMGRRNCNEQPTPKVQAGCWGQKKLRGEGGFRRVIPKMGLLIGPTKTPGLEPSGPESLGSSQAGGCFMLPLCLRRSQGLGFPPHCPLHFLFSVSSLL